MQRRLLILPIVWGIYGIGEVFALNYLFGPILNSVPFIPQDKPISGSYLPALFFNIAAFLAMVAFSLYAFGIWDIDFSSPKPRRDLVAMGVMLGSGFLVFYSAIFAFPLTVSIVYFLATNVE